MMRGQPVDEQRDPGGYVAIYHDIEEMNYGPEVGLPANARVLLCIRHKLLRDGLCEKLIGKKFLMEKTCLDSRQIERAVKYWEKREYILVTRTKTGNVWKENSYQLHPKRFGHLYNWYKNNPTVRVYDGSKVGSYSKKGLPELPVPLPTNLPGGVVVELPVGKELKLSELFDKIASKNPIKEPIRKKPSSEEIDCSAKAKRMGTKAPREIKHQLEWANETGSHLEYDEWYSKKYGSGKYK